MSNHQHSLMSVKRLHYGRVEIFMYDKFKQPERYRFVYRDGDNVLTHDGIYAGSVVIHDSPTYPEDLIQKHTGYLFIKGKRNTIKDKIEEEEQIPYMYEEILIDDRNTVHSNLENLFEEDTRYVIKCIPKHDSTHPLIVHDATFLFSSDEDESIEKNITNIFKMYEEKLTETITEEKIHNISSWVKYLIKFCPINDLGMPICFKQEIRDKDFKDKLKINQDNVILMYDTKTKKEFQIVRTIEQFEDKNREIIFYETYNNILPEVKKRLKKMNKPFKEVSDISIKVRWGDLNELGMTWKITDFI